jgi:ABC-type branched-subunit amino acid transport system substrate-binding protein
MAAVRSARMTISRRSSLTLLASGLVGVLSRSGRAAGKAYGPGVTDSEIKLGQTMPYSGPNSALGTIGRSTAAYYRMINDQGGVNGRKINFLSLDDGYSPPKTVELTRRLVEQDEVLGIFGPLGTATNVAVQRYLNDHKVPQFFTWSGVARMRDPGTFPWTIGGDLAFVNETKAFGRFILETQPAAKVGVLMQNDDFGRDHLTGLKLGLGEKAADMLTKVVTFEVTDATVDSQVLELKESGVSVLLMVTLPKAAAQGLRKMHEIGWDPVKLMAYPGASIPATFKPAGIEASTGVITAEFVKQPGDPAWANDAEMTAYLAFLKQYAADLNPADKYGVMGYYGAAMVVGLLKSCGDELTRENLLRQATHMRGVTVPMLLPGITLNTAPNDYSPIKQMQLQRFDGTGWVKLGGVVGG